MPQHDPFAGLSLNTAPVMNQTVQNNKTETSSAFNFLGIGSNQS